jgi:hypothetical protein
MLNRLSSILNEAVMGFLALGVLYAFMAKGWLR